MINDSLWELKTPKSSKNLHKLIEKGIKQINAGIMGKISGGIILNIKEIKNQMSLDEIIIISLKRIEFKSPSDIKLMIIDGDKILESINL